MAERPVTEREDSIAAFLARNGWQGAQRRALAGDASFRRYERIKGAGGNAILMDAPPSHEDVRPFLRIARHLLTLGYSAPKIIAADEEAGLLLLEDLGDDLYTKVLDEGQGASEEELYAVAVELLADLHGHPPPSGVPPYDDQRLMEEADLLVDWYLPRQRGEATSEDLKAEYREAWAELLPLTRSLPETLVLRDYHADNLIWLPERDRLGRVGLLDFQDAVIGARAYDLVSLLEDARRDVEIETVSSAVSRYLALAPSTDADSFKTAYAVLGAQRNSKIIGIFTRLCERDGKPGYLGYLPRVWKHLERNLEHPALAPVRRWIDREIPPRLRERAP